MVLVDKRQYVIQSEIYENLWRVCGDKCVWNSEGKSGRECCVCRRVFAFFATNTTSSYKKIDTL